MDSEGPLCGARGSEFLKLRWDDVNLEGGYLTFRDTKNGEDRDVPIIGDARAALESLRKTRSEAEYVFVRKNGAPIQDFRRAWINATKKAGLQGRKFHGLRRGMATRLMASGIDSQTARMITGHKDVPPSSSIASSSARPSFRLVRSWNLARRPCAASKAERIDCP